MGCLLFFKSNGVAKMAPSFFAMTQTRVSSLPISYFPTLSLPPSLALVGIRLIASLGVAGILHVADYLIDCGIGTCVFVHSNFFNLKISLFDSTYTLVIC